MRTVLFSAIALATVALATTVSPARAQVPGVDLRLNPRIGLYQPLSDFHQLDDAGRATAAELAGGLALGLGLEADLAFLPVGVRANLDYATGSEVRWTDGGIERETGVETTVLALAADVVFRPLPKILLVSPYLFAGAGLKQYDFEIGTGAVERFENESDPALHLGGGLDVGIGPLALNAEAGDYISWLDTGATDGSEIQHDLFVTVGFVIGIL